MRFRIIYNRLMLTSSLEPDFSKAIHIDLEISRPGAYAYRIEYEPLPVWDPFYDRPAKTQTVCTSHSG
jgi:hypothetical protein